MNITKKAKLKGRPVKYAIVEATRRYSHKRVKEFYGALLEFIASYDGAVNDADGLMAAGMLVSNFIAKIYSFGDLRGTGIPQEQYDLVFKRIKSFADLWQEHYNKSK